MRSCRAIVALLLFGLSACSSDSSSSDPRPDDVLEDVSNDTAPEDTSSDPDDVAPDSDVGEEVDSNDTSEEVDVEEPGPSDPCDPIHEGACAFPWPSSRYLEADETRATGYTLAFPPQALPAARGNRLLDTTPYRRLDGFGLTVPLLLRFPNVDMASLAGEYSIERSVAADAPIQWFAVEEDGLTRVPYWAELDLHEPDPTARTLIVRPALILEENTRYIVAVRDLRDGEGRLFEPTSAFAALRADESAASPDLAWRRGRFEDIFARLEEAGLARQDLQLAWDFHTGSSDGLHGIMLSMVQQAFALTGNEGPTLQIDQVRRNRRSAEDEGSGSVNAHIALEIEGTFEAPHFMRDVRAGATQGWNLRFDPSGRNPVPEGTRSVPFYLRVPWRALDGEPVGVMIYGHGLLGNRYEIRAGHIGRLAQEFGYAVAAVDLAGMSSEDAQAPVSIVSNISNFPLLADRLHQGMLEYLLVTRAMRHQLAALELEPGVTITVDPELTTYFGGSQGAIFGQTYMALTEDVPRGFLAVGGNSYATLLQRSTGFNQFIELFSTTYPVARDRVLLLALVQLLWDNTEPASYVRRIRHTPFPGMAPRNVLKVLSKADYQVAVITNEHTARSFIEIPLLVPYDSDRTPWNVETATYPHDGSGIILYDFGNPWPTNGNFPPNDGLGDPHSLHARVDAVGLQMDTFFRTGAIIDVCGGGPCVFSRNP